MHPSISIAECSMECAKAVHSQINNMSAVKFMTRLLTYTVPICILVMSSYDIINWSTEELRLLMSRPTSHVYAPIQTHRLYDSVVQQVVRQIVSGALAPGSALPIEPMLAQQFGVSRTVIREAIRVLVSKGLLSVKHGSGMWVQPPDHWDNLDPLILFEQVRTGQDDGLLDELIEARRLMELEAARLAAERRTDAELSDLKVALDGMDRAVDAPDEYTRLDVEFHDIILTAARNRVLREALRPVASVLYAGRLVSIRQSGAPEQSLRGHHEIFDAIVRGDADDARAAMQQHIKRFEQDIRMARKQGMWHEAEPDR